LHVRVGAGFTFLVLDVGINCSTIAHAIRTIGAPLEVVDINDPVVSDLCDRDLVFGSATPMIVRHETT
jgi:hypothetical protein